MQLVTHDFIASEAEIFRKYVICTLVSQFVYNVFLLIFVNIFICRPTILFEFSNVVKICPEVVKVSGQSCAN